MNQLPLNRVRRYIQEIVQGLEHYGQWDFRSQGYVKIERWNLNRALETYRTTLTSIRGTMEGETPSSTMVSSASVEWKAERADIGYKVRQTHIGIIRPELHEMVDSWVEKGKPYPSSGGMYYSIPNKSFARVSELSKYPDLRDAILNLGIEDEWLRFWEQYLPLRYEVSGQLLHLLKTGVDKEALSRQNEEAGTGLYIRGRRLKRKDLHAYPDDLLFLLPYAFSMGCAFAAVQLAKLEPNQVWVINAYDPRIKGAIASRSDMEVLDSSWDGERLIIQGVAQTRQAGSDCTGTLANSYSERKIMGKSVTEEVLQRTKRDRVEYPFSSKDTLIKIWTTDAKKFPHKEYVIGQDLGLSTPIKSPADALFSRGFIKIGTKLIPLMLSGSGWTQAVYSVFHNHFIEKAAPGDTLMALGDDMNLLTHESSETMFEPYIKVKSTNPEQNTKKILGLYSAFSVDDDPLGEKDAVVGIVPRVIKTLSSASKRSSEWGESLSNLGLDGFRELAHSERVEELMTRDIHLIKPYMYWRGRRAELNARLRALWLTIAPDIWTALTAHAEEWEHRGIKPEALELTPEDEE